MEIKEVYHKGEKGEISKLILESLPEWFGIPESTQEYIEKSGSLPFFVVVEDAKPLGFLVLKENNSFTNEIYVMGVLSKYHKQGVGRILVNEALKWSREKGYEFMQVKTLDESHPDIHYSITRKFYLSMGFKPLECIPEIWGKENPCLIMIQSIINKTLKG